MPPTLLTVGHGTAEPEAFAALLTNAGVQRLVDVRSYPGSRRHPHMARERLEQWLPEAGIGYDWERRLGGRRPLSRESPDVWWRVDGFRAYAGHMRSAEFAAGFAVLADAVRSARVAIMCSESLWWRCHRRLVADYAVLVAGWQVLHLGHDGSSTPHGPAAGARVEDGLLYYDRLG